MSSKFNTAEESPGFMLWQVTNIWQRAMRTALEPFQLTHPQFVLLFSCKWLNEQNNNSGITQVQLAGHAQMDVNVTSQVLRTLEKKGYILRSPHPTDSRANVISVTDSGDMLASQAVGAVEAADRDFFSGLGDDIQHLNRYLKQLSKS
ncbi:winged helix-turn-helix transcriptional regulator [Bacillus sp. BRMEA1]|uniref:MarR family winged helix-turn-helix transcriptional regulator n=1 Tax=Neobacillus endophyticus TaxID=2738405 RepID=UPI001565BB75|nr:MarR family winged helix-turn-helix transcriptional regulator [Neobacillus endophyticus]NRD77045.1 winged helix-turn-helix transcriptional regulator [Neobacillus endophyticus]